MIVSKNTTHTKEAMLIPTQMSMKIIIVGRNVALQCLRTMHIIHLDTRVAVMIISGTRNMRKIGGWNAIQQGPQNIGNLVNLNIITDKEVENGTRVEVSLRICPIFRAVAMTEAQAEAVAEAQAEAVEKVRAEAVEEAQAEAVEEAQAEPEVGKEAEDKIRIVLLIAWELEGTTV